MSLSPTKKVSLYMYMYLSLLLKKAITYALAGSKIKPLPIFLSKKSSALFLSACLFLSFSFFSIICTLIFKKTIIPVQEDPRFKPRTCFLNKNFQSLSLSLFYPSSLSPE